MAQDRYNLIRVCFILLFVLSSFILTAQEVNTLDKYSFAIQTNAEEDDCSIRALTEALDINYMEARKRLKEAGRSYSKGMKPTLYLRYLYKSRTVQYDKSWKGNGIVTSRNFIDNIAESGHRYIVITRGHTFVLKERGDTWTVYGNGYDMDKPIILIMQVNKDLTSNL